MEEEKEVENVMLEEDLEKEEEEAEDEEEKKEDVLSVLQFSGTSQLLLTILFASFPLVRSIRIFVI